MILVFNSGSSSLKFRAYDVASREPAERASGAITHFGATAQWMWRSQERKVEERVDIRSHSDAARRLLQAFRTEFATALIDAVAHRVVHGGVEFHRPTLLTAETLATLQRQSALAPLHNPLAIEVIETCRAIFGDSMPMIAVFDTAFHATIPDAAKCYALPSSWVKTYGMQRYGFHGLAHRYMYERYLSLDGRDESERVITFQLGNGCSACAIRGGRSVETSMGYTPLEGLIMSTRSGDTDPGILLRLMAEGMRETVISDGFNQGAGLLGLSGASADMQELLELEERGHAGAALAIEAFCHRARKYLGAYLAVLGGADAVIFGGGIGENAPAIRARICADMQWCGLQVDPIRNTGAVGVERCISPADASPAVHVIPVDEERLIARDTRALLASINP